MSDSARVGRQLSLVTIDQAISSASNVLFLALAAHALPLGGFGQFNIIFGTYVLVQVIGRALVSDPLLIHPIDAETRPEATVAATLYSGAGLGLIVVLAGVGLHFLGSSLGIALAVLGVCMPFLLLQDLGRFIGFAARRPMLSVVLDTVWLVLAFGVAVVLIVLHEKSLWAFVAAWAGTGALAGLLLFSQVRRGTRPSSAWIRENWVYSRQYLVGYTAAQGSGLLVSVVGGWIVGNRGLGALRAANLLSRPYGTFQIAASAAATTHVARVHEDEVEVRRHTRKIAILVFAVAAIMSAILLLLPDVLGKIALGGAWPAAKHLLVPVCAGMFATAATTPARSSLVGLKYVALATRIDVFAAVSAVLGSMIGAWVGGVSGALWAVVIMNFVSAGLYRVALLAKMGGHWTPRGKHVLQAPR